MDPFFGLREWLIEAEPLPSAPTANPDPRNHAKPQNAMPAQISALMEIRIIPCNAPLCNTSVRGDLFPASRAGIRCQPVSRCLSIHRRFDASSRGRFDRIGSHRVGRLEDRQGGPEPHGRRNIGTGDQLPESRYGVGGQRTDIGPEPLGPIGSDPVQLRDELRISPQPFGHSLRVATSQLGPVGLGSG